MGLCVCAPLESTDEIAEYWLQQQNAYGILASHLSLDGMWVTCNSDNNSHKSSYLVYTRSHETHYSKAACAARTVEDEMDAHRALEKSFPVSRCD